MIDAKHATITIEQEVFVDFPYAGLQITIKVPYLMDSPSADDVFAFVGRLKKVLEETK